VVGEARAVKDKAGVVLNLLLELEVEALPTDLPEKIEVDVTGLAVINDSIKVSQLKLGDKVKVLTDSEKEIVKIAPLVSKEAEQMAKEAEAAAAAAAAQAAAAAPVEEGKPAAEAAPAASAPAKETAKTPKA
jgi:large subunit ribosomal protein L25